MRANCSPLSDGETMRTPACRSATVLPLQSLSRFQPAIDLLRIRLVIGEGRFDLLVAQPVICLTNLHLIAAARPVVLDYLKDLDTGARDPRPTAGRPIDKDDARHAPLLLRLFQ